MTMAEMPSVELLTAFARAPNGKQATGFSYQDLLEALREDPDEAVIRFRALLKDARPSVRAWACIAGAKAAGRKFVPTLLEAFSDRSQAVQEMVISGLLEIDPSAQLLRPLAIRMRQRLLTWTDDGAPRIARLLAILNDTDAAPYIERYLHRHDLDPADRTRGEVFLIYLTEGMEGVLNRIRNHADHDRMPYLGRLVFALGTPDVDTALENLAASAPDERCRLIGEQTLEALKAARSDGPPPFWNRKLSYANLPPAK